MPTYAAETDYSYGSSGTATIRVECTIPTLTDAMTSMTLTAVGKFITNGSMADSTNGWAYTGDGVVDASGTNKAISHGGSGGTTTYGSATQSHTLSYTATKSVSVTFKITNVDAVGSTMTVTRSVTIPKRLPDPPSTPAAPTISGIGATGATVNWAAPASNGAALDGYDLQWSTSSTFASDVTTHHSDVWHTTLAIPATLLKATTYYARIRATNAEGNSAYSSGVSFTTLATVPSAPTCAAALITSTGATVSILPGDSGGAAITSHEVQYSLSNAFTSPTTLTTTTTTRTIAGLVRNTFYYVRTRSINSLGAGAWSPTISFTTLKTVPTAPLSPSVTGTAATTATLAYSAPSDNGGDSITSYNVQHSLSASFTSPTNTNVGMSLTPTVTVGTPNTLFYFRVQAITAQGAGAWSSTFSGTTAPGVPGIPQSLALTDLQAEQASFSWSPPVSDGGSALIGYRGYITDVTLGGAPVGFDIANVTTIDVLPLIHSHQYTFAIAARNAIGTGSQTGTVSFTTLHRAPFAAAAPAFSAVTSNGMTVTAAVPSDNGGSAITSYVMQYATNIGFTGDVTEVTGATVTFPIIGMLPGTTYYVRTAAVNTYGQGDWSATGTQATVAGFSGLIGASVGLVATATPVVAGEMRANASLDAYGITPGALNSDAPITIPSPLRAAIGNIGVPAAIEAWRNLCTNPSFESTSGTVEVFRNLATNPSFEATSGTVEVRRNLCTNPIMETNDSKWVYASAGFVIRPATGGHTGTYFMRYTHAAGGSITGTGDLCGSGTTLADAQATLAASTVYTASAYVRPSQTITLQATLNFRNAAGANQGNLLGSGVVCPAGVWTRLGVVGSTNSSTACGGFRVGLPSTTSVSAGFTVDVDAALIELAPVVLPYFDGSASPDTDLTASWTGTANASASILTAPLPTGVSGGSGRVNFSSTQWAGSGIKSVRIVATGTNAGSQAGAVVGTLASRGFIVGDVVTIQGTLRMTGPQTGSPPVYARTIWIGDGPALAASTQAPNAAGVTRLTFTFTVTDASAPIRLAHGGQVGDPDVWWDDLVVVAGTYTGPYFDGANQAKVRRNLAANPHSALTALAMEGGGAGAATVSAEQAHSGTTSTKFVWSSGARGISVISAVNGATSWLTFTPNTTYTISFWVYLDSGSKPTFAINTGSYNQTGLSISNVNLNASALPYGVWTRLSVTVVSTGAVAGLRLYDTRPSASTYYVDDVLVEEALTLGDYFDGATPIAPYTAAWEGTANASPSYLYDGDLTNSWVGSANASASRLMGVGTVGIPGGGQAVKVSSTQWSKSGARSIRLIPSTPASNTSYMVVTAAALGLVAGNTYTAVVTCRLSAPLTGTLESRTRRLMGRPGDGGSDVLSGTPPNAAGETELRVTVTIPIGATMSSAGFYFFNGASQGNGDVWWDDLLIVEGVYTGPYFDGSVSPYPWFTPAWVGAAHASASTLSNNALLGFPGCNVGLVGTHRQAPDLRVAVGLLGTVSIDAVMPVKINPSDITQAIAGGPHVVNVGLVGTLTPRPYGDQTFDPELHDMLEVFTLEPLPLDEPLDEAGFEPVLPSIVTLNVVKGH